MYVRASMYLLFVAGGKREITLLEENYLKSTFINESVKMGKHYDDPTSAAKIPGFVKEFNLDLTDLLEPDISKYKTFNEFFYRKLKPDLRQVDTQAASELGVVSPADCRCCAFEAISLAQKFWIKGDQFTMPTLLGDAERAKAYENGSIIISRLAPQDYHRFHSPIDGQVQDRKNIDGNLWTVNPMVGNAFAGVCFR